MFSIVFIDRLLHRKVHMPEIVSILIFTFLSTAVVQFNLASADSNVCSPLTIQGISQTSSPVDWDH